MLKKLSRGRVKKSTKKGAFFKKGKKGEETRFARMDDGELKMDNEREAAGPVLRP
jgi:hypothetical protein